MTFFKLPGTHVGEDSDVYISDGDLYMIAMMWAAPETKGKPLDGSKGQTVISGNVKTTIYNFERTTMKVSGRNDSSPTSVVIQWKNRMCKDPASKNPKQLRSPFELLSGYKMTEGHDFEGGAYGAIWRDGGLSIEYSFDNYSAIDVESISKHQELWRLEQTSGINKFVIVYTRTQELVVSMIYPVLGNFRSKIHDQKELAEVLLTILSTDISRGYPIDEERIQLLPPHKN
jgi:hypothetical protein